MTFSELLERSVARAGNPVCFGMDPVLSRMPAASTPEETIRSFYLSIFDEMDRRKVYPAAVKPNSAYYEQVSVEALLVLRELIGAARDRGIPVILDAKRGDIGKSSAAYARAAFGTMGADATTVSPYMGGDSVGPFLKVAPERGVYALLRTSNPGAADLQDQRREDGARLAPLEHPLRPTRQAERLVEPRDVCLRACRGGRPAGRGCAGDGSFSARHG